MSTKKNENVAEEQSTEQTPVNKTTAKQIKVHETVTQKEMLESRMEELLAEKMSKMEANEVILGCTVQRITLSEGKERLDRDGNVMVNQETGEPLKWSDNFYVDITFMGGQDTLRLKPEQVKGLEVGKRYVAHGRVKMVTPQEGKAYTTIEYTEFDRLF